MFLIHGLFNLLSTLDALLPLATCPAGSMEDFQAEQWFGRGCEEGGSNDANRHQETQC